MSGGGATILILPASFFVTTILRSPVAHAMAPFSVFCLLYQGLPLTTICQQMVKGISTSSLMVVPSFIIMDCLMGSGGISEKLIVLANTCVEQMWGDMATVSIMASYFFGGISGSVAADTASIGFTLIPMMAEQGYDDDFSTTVTITSSCESLLVPPSHSTVIYATAAEDIPVGGLFLVGYIPGALLIVSLMVGSYIIFVKRNCPKGGKFSIANLLKQLDVSFWALVAVLTVVVGVADGAFAATESVATAVIYSLIVSVLIYRGLDWEGMWKVVGGCMETLSIVLILISTSSIFDYRLACLHVPATAANVITGLTNNPATLAPLPNPILLILDRIMDVASTILIAISILMPTTTSIGINPIQFGIMVVLDCGVGPLIPPVGAALFIRSAASKVLMRRVVKVTLSFYLCMIITLLLITFIPATSLWLPQVLP